MARIARALEASGKSGHFLRLLRDLHAHRFVVGYVRDHFPAGVGFGCSQNVPIACSHRQASQNLSGQQALSNTVSRPLAYTVRSCRSDRFDIGDRMRRNHGEHHCAHLRTTGHLATGVTSRAEVLRLAGSRACAACGRPD